jgi:hypothetical protein
VRAAASRRTALVGKKEKESLETGKQATNSKFTRPEQGEPKRADFRGRVQRVLVACGSRLANARGAPHNNKEKQNAFAKTIQGNRKEKIWLPEKI